VIRGRPDVSGWQRSKSCESGACVEVAFAGGVVALRASKKPDKVVTFSRDQWKGFVADAKNGAFDFA
jgi:Domain of unknown function (DUF397)